MPDRPTCFVVMGFGKKTDPISGKVFDLDMSYQWLIKPAVEAAGATCRRADEIVHAKVIDIPMYEQEGYWMRATMAEVHAGLGNAAGETEWLAKALALGPEPWMVSTTEEQIEKLRQLLAATAG